ncbi:hypothetical protein CHS0354_000807 [Potamilus streckersoni]|uniref:ABC transporter domain-containing protein n=1 Tax=Potamilus streckersoni TaxID=2493646 RepID=A0AAE0T8H5_9BIVA|nr:hypothetical protein CHS0354_000807 [Potamilus streckersoni]
MTKGIIKKEIIIAISITFFANACGRGVSYDASGSFEADETIISAEASGMIKSFVIEEGQQLKAGDRVGYIDSVQLYLRKKQLEAQIAALISKKPNVSVQLAALQEQLKTAEKERTRIENLVKGDAATLKQLDDINANLEVIKKQIAAQKSSLDIVSEGMNMDATPLYLQVQQLQDQLSKCKLINPISGTVLTKYVEQNEMVSVGKPLYKIADLSKLTLRVYISGNQLAQVRLNQNVAVFIDDEDGGLKEAQGTVTWISEKAEFTPKTIQTKDERANMVYAMKVKVVNDGSYKIGIMSDIIVNHISKTYNKGEVRAVTDVSFSVEKGELFGLIGPDGAGKTSLIRILTTLLVPDEGRASVNGFDVVMEYKEIRKRVGYMPGKFSLYQDLSVEENLNFFATVFNTTLKANYELIQDIYVHIEPFKNRRAGNLSGGMKQKLALCCALIHRPTVLFLDEPTTGVDTVSRKEFWGMLKRLKQQGITILVSTPYMDEASLCERIALIQSGGIMSINTPEKITKAFPHKLFAIRANQMSRLLSDLRQSIHIQRCYTFGEFHHIMLTRDEDIHLESLLIELAKTGHLNVEVKPVVPTIEDCFINLMN